MNIKIQCSDMKSQRMHLKLFVLQNEGLSLLHKRCGRLLWYVYGTHRLFV